MLTLMTDLNDSEREKTAAVAEQNAAKANASLVQIENSISTITEQIKSKRNEIKGTYVQAR